MTTAQELVDEDLVPDPVIVAAALRACRRVNDFSLTTRILEITEQKSKVNKQYRHRNQAEEDHEIVVY